MGDSVSDPALPPGFTDEVTGAAPLASPVPQPTPEAESYRAGLESLINTGADRATIDHYITAHRVDPAQVKGLDEAIAAVGQGHKVKIPVQLIGPAPQAPPPGFTDEPPPGFTDEVPVHDDPLKAHSLTDELGIGARGILHGVGQFPDAAASIGDLLSPATWITGIHSPTDFGVKAAGAVSDAAGFIPDSQQTDNERLASAAISGATGGLLTAPLGGEGAFPALAGILSGAGGGGAQELARQSGAGPMGQLAAGVAGGFLAPATVAVGGRALQALPRMAERELNPVAQAFHDQQVPALPADVGGHATRLLTAGASKLTLAGIPLEKAAQASVEAARAARSRIAGNIGTVGNELTAGQAAQAGANKFLATSGDTATNLYEAIPIAADRLSKVDSTRQALADITQGLTSNPELSRIWTAHPRLKATLEALTGTETAASRAADMQAAQDAVGRAQQGVTAAQARVSEAVQRRQLQPGIGDREISAASQEAEQAASALEKAQRQVSGEAQRAATPIRDGSVSWPDMKRLRSIVGEIVGKPGLASEGHADAAMRNLYGALSEDMRATAVEEGPKAIAAFNQANTFWRDRQQLISDVITPILGKDGNATAEQAFRKIQSWAGNRGSFVRSAQALQSMPEEEANAVRATIFDQLGNAPAGQQGAAGDVFSPSAFLTQWNKIPTEARSVLFPGAQYQKDIADLVTIADAQKAAAKLGQGSPTAHLIQAGHIVGRVGALFAHFFVSPLTAIAQMGADVGGELAVGKLLSNPGFARWLASSVKKPNAAAQLAHVNRLTSLAARQPAIANDVLALQERLAGAFAQAPQPLAAQDQGQ